MTDPDASGIIDAHSHIWTRDVTRFPLAPGKTLRDLRPPSFTDAELLAVARRAGVNRVVLIQHSTFHACDNRYVCDAVARRPDTFRAVGMLDHTQPGVRDRMRELLTRGVTGFRIVPGRAGAGWLEASGMQTMWRCAAETGQAMCCLLDPRFLPTLVPVCARFPETPVVIDHLGRIGADGTVREEDVEALCELARFEAVSVKISAFYALGRKAPPYVDLVPLVRRVVDAFGPTRCMWASDAPYQLAPPHTYAASLALVCEHLEFLSAGDREWLLAKTAENVFFKQGVTR